MRQRCREKGFELDPRWDSFEAFVEDMGPRPPGGEYTLDRVDPADRRYGPGLCRWVCKRGQTRNRQNTVYLTDADGTCRPLGEWAERKGVSADTMNKRRRRGGSDPEVIHGRSRTGSWGVAQTDDELLDQLPYPVDRESKLQWERAYQWSSREHEGRIEFMICMINKELAPIEDTVTGWHMMGCPRPLPPDTPAHAVGPIQPTSPSQWVPRPGEPTFEELDQKWNQLMELKIRCLKLIGQDPAAIATVRVNDRAKEFSERPGGLNVANEQRLSELVYGPDSSGAPPTAPPRVNLGGEDEEGHYQHEDDDENVWP
jgi:hypothetical protein